MENMRYLDFDLQIERAAQDYCVQVDSPAGQATHTFSLPFSDLELENFLLRLGHTPRGVRRIDSPESDQQTYRRDSASKPTNTIEVGPLAGDRDDSRRRIVCDNCIRIKKSRWIAKRWDVKDNTVCWNSIGGYGSRRANTRAADAYTPADTNQHATG